MSSMSRRDFLRGACGTAVALVAIPIRQDSTRGAADPLSRPDWAGGPRAEVGGMDNDDTVKAIERRLGCTCGCGLDIYTCRTTDFTCTYSPALHQEVVGLLAGGRTPDEVVDDFVAKYGETVLMAPRARGFGALGYVLPGSLVVLAGSILAFVLLRREPARVVAEVPANVVAAGPASARPPATDAELEQLERTLGELES